MSSRSENSDDAAQRMLAAVPGALALGRGPVPNGGFSRHDYHHPAAGWGAAGIGHPQRAGVPPPVAYASADGRFLKRIGGERAKLMSGRPRVGGWVLLGLV